MEQEQEEHVQIEAKEMPKFKRIYENDIKTNLKKKHFTLDEIKKGVQDDSFSWYTSQNIPTNEKSIAIGTVEGSLRETTEVISRKEVSKFIDTMNDYPLAIRIPRKVWKEGYMYRVKDCFYDDKGDFLYRVPGLITDEDR